MNVPLLDLEATHGALRAEIEAAVQRVLREQHFIMGPDVATLEKALSRYLEVKHAITCASGSDALLLALMALSVGQGDEVITTPYSFFATAGAIARLGAIPVFVDIELETFNLDASKVAAAISPRTRAILPVHLFGQCAELDVLSALSQKVGVPLVEDAAQALGSRWNGQAAGNFGIMGCFSFYPTKNLGAFGDGGLVTTSDDALAQRLRALRTHGGTRKYHYEYVGMNSRLDTLQAAILSVKLPHLEKWHAARRHNAGRYYALFEQAGCGEQVILPAVRSQAFHIYNQFVVRVRRRDALKTFLAERGIGTEVYYPKSLHKQPCFASLAHLEGDFPKAEEAEATSLALPVYPGLVEEQLAYVVDCVRAFYRFTA